MNCTEMNNDTIYNETAFNQGLAQGGVSHNTSTTNGLDTRFNKVDQVVAWMGDRIDMRFYAPGARVPSVRQLAERLNVSRFTIVHAYDKLVAAGVLVSRAGSGFYVASSAGEKITAAPKADALNEQANVSALDTTWLMRHIFSDVAEDCSPGSGLLPKSWLENERVGVAARAVVRSCDGYIYDYGNVQGYEPLREQMVVQLHKIGMAARPEHMVTTQGVSAAIDLVARYFLRPGDAVLVDDPSWFWLYGSLRAQGLRVIGVPRDPDGPDIDVLTRIMQHDKPKLYVTNSVLHNPTSWGVSPARAYQVLRLMDEHDAYVLEDDIYGDFHAGAAKGAPALRYAALDQFKRVFYIAGFAKSLAADLRVAVLCCPAEHIQGIAGRKMLSSMVSPELNERIVHRLLADGQHRRHLERLRQRITNAHVRLREVLPKIGLQYPPLTQDGLFIWVDTGVDTNALALAAMNDGWLVAPGGLFSPSQGTSTFMRLNVSRTSDAFLMWLKAYVAQVKTQR